MENNNYTPEFLKKVSLIIENDRVNVKEYDAFLYESKTYEVFSINCFYDPKRPSEFLDVLMKKVFQFDNDFSLEYTGVEFFIKYKNSRICKFYFSKRCITLELISTGEELVLQFGNKINNLNVFKFIYQAVRIANLITKIKDFYMSYEGFQIIDVTAAFNHFTETFRQFRRPSDKLYITVENMELEYYFLVTYNFGNNIIEFNHYLEHEGEHYSNGNDPLTDEMMMDRLEKYTNLLKSKEDIQLFIQTLKEKICLT